jgi:hypothetical protein
MMKSLNRIFILFLVLLCISVALLNQNNSMQEKFATPPSNEKCQITLTNDDEGIMTRCNNLNLNSKTLITCDKGQGRDGVRNFHNIYCSDWYKKNNPNWATDNASNCADNISADALKWREKCNDWQCNAVKHCRLELDLHDAAVAAAAAADAAAADNSQSGPPPTDPGDYATTGSSEGSSKPV